MKTSIWPVNTNSQDQIECSNAPNTQIKLIIDILSKQFNIPPEQIKLIACGRILDSSATISQIFPSNLGFMSMIVCKPKIAVIPPIIHDKDKDTENLLNDSLKQLIDMGFDKKEAEQALLMSRGNVQFSASLLASGGLSLLAEKLGMQGALNQGSKANLNEKDLECIENMKRMGFDEKKATIAYIAANKDYALAIEGLLQASS
jgi:UBA/TS-N domain